MKEGSYIPPYVLLQGEGELRRRGEALWSLYRKCRLCPRDCGVDRLSGEKGICMAGSKLKVYSFHAHFGEERALVGAGGSGTIFLSHCNLGCVFCQNWDISHMGSGTEITADDLAGMMLQLQQEGCLNINVVTPTHFLPHIVLGLDRAAARGLRIPLVYNTCGWEKPEILKLLDGIVDIYLADFKYMNPDKAARYSNNAKSYPEITCSALIEMNRQVGVALARQDGMIYRGLMIRHLVMPGKASGSLEAMQWIAANLPLDTYVNIMAQYRPAHHAHLFPEINRSPSGEEYRNVVMEATKCGLLNLDVNI